MANRNIQSKILKQKRRGRFARFTGATAKFAVRVDRGRFDANGKAVEIPVGEMSLSKAVISTGRGPNAERMQAYYARVNSQSYETTLPEDLGIKDERYSQVWDDTPKENRLNLENNGLRRLDLYFTIKEWFFVEIDLRRNVIRRSRVYGSKAFAMGRLKNEMVAWVEEISLRKPT